MTEILRRHAFSITFLSVFVLFVFWASGTDEEIHRFSGFTMGTSYELQIVGAYSPDQVQELADQLEALLGRLDKDVFSTYSSESELSRFNRHEPGDPFSASQELIEVLLLARQVSEQSRGAFDVTIGPLVNLWGFGPELAMPERVPSEAAIAEAMNNVGFDYLVIDESSGAISKQREIYVDLSAIAKGYAVDVVGSYLSSLGVGSYFLEIGGELKMTGLKPGGESWIPAIESPEAGEARIYAIIFSRGETVALAGSGDYRNYFQIDGQRYSHEIDPRTGRPISHRLAAAYVLDESAARADALATAFMIMGLDESKRLAEDLGLAVYFISKNENERNNEGFDDYYSPAFAEYLSE